MHLTLPERFQAVIQQPENQRLYSELLSVLSDYSSIVKPNRLEFFPNFTDHGLEHLQNVLSASEKIITDEGLDKITGADVAALVLAIILHDLGMHITQEGFETLLGGAYDRVRVAFFDDKTWKELWEEFLIEAKHFSGKQCKNIFGKDQVHISGSKSEMLHEDYILLVGEFIRRHHARLAHEIALHGFPGANGNTLEFAAKLDSEFRNIVGVIARSHGNEIRNAIDFLKEEFDRTYRFPRKVHAPFLMVVLRIADYIQITSERAPSIVLKTRLLSSPVSQREWELHDSILDVSVGADDDPEVLFVNAKPENSTVFLKAEKLFKDIQYELDMSWAVLGEVYGRYRDFKQLQIKFRRIRTSIDNKKKFAEKVDFIPENIVFDSDPELLQLLISPLYGNDPSFGVREMLQNAVDSCIERSHIEKKIGRDYLPELTVEIKEDLNGEYLFTITDNGLGMSLDVIKNYFLKAGASFRKSDDWIKLFTDDVGNSEIRRSGRFGIGVLAAFLLGRKIIITTQDYYSNLCLSFEAVLDCEQIEVKKVSPNLPGTQITIFLGNKIVDVLKKQIDKYHENQKVTGRSYFQEDVAWFDWYLFESPMIQYIIPSSWSQIKTRNQLSFNESWRRFFSENLEIWWTYRKGTSFRTIDKLTCNGFRVPDGYFLHSNIIHHQPKLAIIDPNGELPLSLNRNELNVDYIEDERLSFEIFLEYEICKEILAQLLTIKDVQSPFETTFNIKKSLSTLNHPGLAEHWDSSHLLYTNEGFNLCHPKVLRNLPNKHLIIFFSKSNIKKNVHFANIDSYIVLKRNVLDKKFQFSYKLEPSEMHHSDYTLNSLVNIEANLSLEGRRIFMSKYQYKYFFTDKTRRLGKRFKKRIAIERELGNWNVIKDRATRKTFVSDEFVLNHGDDFQMIIEYFYNEACEFDDVYSITLENFLGEEFIIPYSLEERKRKFPKAFEILKDYM